MAGNHACGHPLPRMLVMGCGGHGLLGAEHERVRGTGAHREFLPELLPVGLGQRLERAAQGREDRHEPRVVDGADGYEQGLQARRRRAQRTSGHQQPDESASQGVARLRGRSVQPGD